MPSDYGDQETRPISRGPEREHVPDHNELMQRRAIAAGVIVLFLIVVVLLARGCASSAKERGIKNFIQESTTILSQSNQSSRDFFGLLRDPGDAGATEIETSVNEQRSLASELVRRANAMDPPGDLKPAQDYLVESLEFRRDGLTEISEQVGQALGDQEPEAATELIAANMQQFLTSDVIYSQRTYAIMNKVVKDNEIEGQKLPASRFLPSLEWLDPGTVEEVFGRIRGGGGSDEPVAPGTHGTGITGVSAQPSGTELSEGGENNLAEAKEIVVNVQNQGENNESDVEVSLRISGSGFETITLRKNIASINAGQTVNLTIPLTRTPPAGTSADLKVTVRRVPGEENTENNTQTFGVDF